MWRQLTARKTSTSPFDASAGQREAALGPPRAGRRGAVRGVDDGGLPAAAGLPRLARRLVPGSVNIEVKPPEPPPAPAALRQASAPALVEGQGGRERRRAVELAREIVAAFEALAARGSGKLELPGGAVLELGNLSKPLWPALGLTKGDLFRYYLAVSPFLLPVVRDRPLVMKRFPDGIAGNAFYQQRAPETVPRGVRSERVDIGDDVPARLVGGDLATLLYMVQLAAISQDPWFSRAQSPQRDGLRGHRSRSRWTRRRSRACATSRAGCATSSTRWAIAGLAEDLRLARPAHLPAAAPRHARTSRGCCFARSSRRSWSRPAPRGGDGRADRQASATPTTVYIDCLQNIVGKTLACAYSARASDYAGRVDAARLGRARRPSSIRAPSPSGRCPRASPRSAISGPVCARRRGSIWRPRWNARQGRNRGMDEIRRSPCGKSSAVKPT